MWHPVRVCVCVYICLLLHTLCARKWPIWNETVTDAFIIYSIHPNSWCGWMRWMARMAISTFLVDIVLVIWSSWIIHVMLIVVFFCRPYMYLPLWRFVLAVCRWPVSNKTTKPFECLAYVEVMFTMYVHNKDEYRKVVLPTYTHTHYHAWKRFIKLTKRQYKMSNHRALTYVKAVANPEKGLKRSMFRSFFSFSLSVRLKSQLKKKTEMSDEFT